MATIPEALAQAFQHHQAGRDRLADEDLGDVHGRDTASLKFRDWLFNSAVARRRRTSAALPKAELCSLSVKFPTVRQSRMIAGCKTCACGKFGDRLHNFAFARIGSFVRSGATAKLNSLSPNFGVKP